MTNGRPQFQERHQDYVLGPNQDARLASVAAGQQITGLALPLDADAPFVLRSRALRIKYISAASRTQNGLQFLNMRYTGPDRDYRSQGLTPQTIQMAYFGQNGLSLPLHRQIVYPAQGVIYVDIHNTGSGALTNVYLYFRGVKLYPWGQVPGYTYPPNCRTLPFSYPQQVASLPVTTASMGLRQVFTVKDDADFVLRGLCQGAASGSTYEVFVKFLDHQEKPYSNDFVHVDIMGGAAGGFQAYPSGSAPTDYSPVLCGPAAPGLFYPEIYLPRNAILYYDTLRSDSGYAGAATVNFNYNFIGAKVFAGVGPVL
jgi:hypothetical protein